MSSLNVSATSFVENAADVGGAIAACSKSQDNTCSGTYRFSSFRATANRARTADGEKSGGGFANINGGSTTMRDVTLAGNSADGLGSALNLRYAEAWFYTVQAPGQTIFLSQNGQLDAYCSPGLQLVVGRRRDHDDSGALRRSHRSGGGVHRRRRGNSEPRL